MINREAYVFRDDSVRSVIIYASCNVIFTNKRVYKNIKVSVFFKNRFDLLRRKTKVS